MIIKFLERLTLYHETSVKLNNTEIRVKMDIIRGQCIITIVLIQALILTRSFAANANYTIDTMYDNTIEN